MGTLRQLNQLIDQQGREGTSFPLYGFLPGLLSVKESKAEAMSLLYFLRVMAAVCYWLRKTGDNIFRVKQNPLWGRDKLHTVATGACLLMRRKMLLSVSLTEQQRKPFPLSRRWHLCWEPSYPRRLTSSNGVAMPSSLPKDLTCQWVRQERSGRTLLWELHVSLSLSAKASVITPLSCWRSVST